MKKIKTNDVDIAYVTYDEKKPKKGGKYRPVIIIDIEKNHVLAFRITTKYKSKPNLIKKQYYGIRDWDRTGLNDKSWVDVGMVERFPKKDLEFKKIGFLTTKDVIGLNDFVNKYIEKNQFIGIQKQPNKNKENENETTYKHHLHNPKKEIKKRNKNKLNRQYKKRHYYAKHKE